MARAVAVMQWERGLVLLWKVEKGILGIFKEEEEEEEFDDSDANEFDDE